jgi:glycosyltransferase involved in cell wall biosynthesis
MKILFVTNFYPPHELGGYGQWCREVAEGLKQRGHEVQVLTSRYQRQTGKLQEGNGVYRTLYLEANNQYYRPSDFFLKRPFREKANLDQLERCLDRYKPGVVMFWGMWNLSLKIPKLAENLLPGKIAYFIASYWPMDLDLHSKYWLIPARHRITELIKGQLRKLALSQLRKEDYPTILMFENAFCCSQYVRDTLVIAGKIPNGAKILYGGINPNPLYKEIKSDGPPINRPLKLMYFGRLISDKGVHLAIEALGILLQRGFSDRFHLTILGDGHPGYVRMLRSRILDLGLENNIRFENWIPRNKIPDWIKKFDVYLFTSVWPEPMARSVMEAMAAGLLVIGSEVGGQTEMLVNNENSLTFPAGNFENLAEQIQNVIDNPSIVYKLANAGQNMVLDKFQLTRMVNDIEANLFSLHS